MNKLTILITGASSGIGKSLAINCVQAGHDVVAIARREEKLEELKKELSPEHYSYYSADVSDRSELKKIKNDLERRKMLPEVVINAAGIFEKDSNPYNPDAVRKIMNVNFFGTLNTVETFLDIFLKNKRGHFICLSSIASWKPNPRGVSYSASKAAVAMAFRGLNLQYEKSNVHFSTIYLGPVETEMWEGKKSAILVTPDFISKKILKLISKPRPVSYMPFLSTTLSRLSALIPDWWYAKLSSYLFK